MSWGTPITERVPGMRPGRHARNVIVAIIVGTIVLFAIAVLPITMLVIALVLPVLLVFNVRGLHDWLAGSILSRLPGLGSERRLVLSGAAFVYLFIVFIAVTAAWPTPAPVPAGNNTTTTNTTATDTTVSHPPAKPQTTTSASTTTTTQTSTDKSTTSATTTVPSTPDPTSMPTPTATPTQVDAHTATTTPTSTPTATPTATATATPTSKPSVSSPIEGGTARIATITRIIDGDTFEVRFKNGETDTVRLIGVDTPEPIISNMDPSEYGIPDTTAGRDWLLRWADEASNYATTKLEGEQVRVVTDPQVGKRGYYGRLLAYVYDDGESFGKQLLERGLARVYTGESFALEDEYLAIEADAQAANRGLWGFEGTTTPTATPEPTPVPTDGGNDDDNGGGGGVDYPPPSNDGAPGDKYDCGDFSDPSVAQQWYDSHNPEEDPSGLDSDGDGQACESL